MGQSQIRIERAGEVATLVLARPDTRNAMSEPMGVEIAAAVDELNRDATLRAVIVRGEGKAFSAGGDFEVIERRAKSDPPTNQREMLRFYRLYLSVRELRVPVLAAVHGAAMGAGLCFAMACDIRLCAAGTKLGVNFVRIGLHPGMGATFLLPRLIGPGRAADLLLSGRTIEASEAYRIGLVDELHPVDALLDAAAARAAEIARAAPLAVMKAKASLRRGPARSLDEALDMEATAQSLDYASADLAEGIRAFHEKRPPRFEGR